jgi:hypothetical protein
MLFAATYLGIPVSDDADRYRIGDRRRRGSQGLCRQVERVDGSSFLRALSGSVL